jgi:hypothetical protein
MIAFPSIFIQMFHVTDDLLMFQRVEFPMPSNQFSFQLANRRWDLLANGVYRDLFSFDKVSI